MNPIESTAQEILDAWLAAEHGSAMVKVDDGEWKRMTAAEFQAAKAAAPEGTIFYIDDIRVMAVVS